MNKLLYRGGGLLATKSHGSAGPKVQCRAGGPGGFGGGQPGQPQRLIIPGMEGSGDPGRKLVMPSQGRSSGMVGQESPTPLNNFRPPPGFMDAVDKPTVRSLLPTLNYLSIPVMMTRS